MKTSELRAEYVEFMPKTIEEGVLYISEKYGTAVHKCCCGCGQKVVTPLKPTEWSLSKTAVGVTLRPSIGNWSFPCRSHYWIRNSRVVWAGDMSSAQIERGRRRDRAAKQEYFSVIKQQRDDSDSTSASKVSNSFLRLLKWIMSGKVN